MQRKDVFGRTAQKRGRTQGMPYPWGDIAHAYGDYAGYESGMRAV